MEDRKISERIYNLIYALWRKEFGTNEAYELEKDERSAIEMLQDLLEQST